MSTSTEGHIHCTRNNSPERINSFTKNIEVQLNATTSTLSKPFNINDEKETIASITTKSSDPPTNESEYHRNPN